MKTPETREIIMKKSISQLSIELLISKDKVDEIVIVECRNKIVMPISPIGPVPVPKPNPPRMDPKLYDALIKFFEINFKNK